MRMGDQRPPVPGIKRFTNQETYQGLPIQWASNEVAPFSYEEEHTQAKADGTLPDLETRHEGCKT